MPRASHIPDIPCSRCGYDLVGLDDSKPCPECELSGPEAHAPAPLACEDPQRLRSLVVSIRLLGWARILTGSIIVISIAQVINLSLTGSSLSSAFGSAAMYLSWSLYALSLVVALHFATRIARIPQLGGSRIRWLLVLAVALSAASNISQWIATFLGLTLLDSVPYFFPMRQCLLYIVLRSAALVLPIVMTLATVRVAHAARCGSLAIWFWSMLAVKLLLVAASLLAVTLLTAFEGHGPATTWLNDAMLWATAIESWSQDPIGIITGIVTLCLARHLQRHVLPRTTNARTPVQHA